MSNGEQILAACVLNFDNKYSMLMPSVLSSHSKFTNITVAYVNVKQQINYNLAFHERVT